MTPEERADQGPLYPDREHSPAPKDAPSEPFLRGSTAKTPYEWVCHTGSLLSDFKEAPSRATRALLIEALQEHLEATRKGLKMPQGVPPVRREAVTSSEWYRRLLDESLSQFNTNPSKSRLQALEQHLQEFLEAVSKGRIRP